MCEQGSIVLYVHGNQKARQDGQPRTATSTLTQLLNYDNSMFSSLSNELTTDPVIELLEAGVYTSASIEGNAKLHL